MDNLGLVYLAIDWVRSLFSKKKIPVVKAAEPLPWDGQVYPDVPGIDPKKHIGGEYITDAIADEMFKQGYGMYILKYNEKTERHRILVMRNVQEKNF